MNESTLVVLATFTSLSVSSIAGYGGSLLLVPSLSAILGPKSGIALAALLLAWNNVFKVIAYRETLALRQGWPLLAVTGTGVLLGGSVLIALPTRWAHLPILAITIVSLMVEVFESERFRLRRRWTAAPLLAVSSFLSGATGSSGPLKGVAIRNLGLPRLHHVGLASSISLVGDGLKAPLFAEAGLLPELHWSVLIAALPLMPAAAFVGLHVNRRVGESTFRWIFWGVVGAYSLRMMGAWP